MSPSEKYVYQKENHIKRLEERDTTLFKELPGKMTMAIDMKRNTIVWNSTQLKTVSMNL